MWPTASTAAPTPREAPGSTSAAVGIDSDGDGVYDGIDQCPDTPRGVRVDARGCPTQEVAPSLFPAGQATLVLNGVYFASDRSDLSDASKGVLDGVAVQLQAYGDVRVEVAGHTDSTNTEQYNQKLSERRAESVRAYLESRGVAPDRMTANGYGEAVPIADNTTVEGRTINRRVELVRLP